jgi:NAD(P)H dehydrogenase (quinone)
MILVTGAAGKTGKAIIKVLAAKGVPVRALVRKPQNVSVLQALGAAQVIVGGFDESAALARAADGVQAIYHICPNVSRDEVAYARAVVAAAQAKRVRRFVFHSVLHPQTEAMPHHWEKMRVEDMLLASGFDLTVLQPTVDLDDVAAAAGRVLTENGHNGATYELVGTWPLSQTEVAAAIGGALKREVRAEAEPVEVWEARARADGQGDYERSTLVAMFRYYAAHGLIGNPNALKGLLGRPPNSLAHFLGHVGPQGAA